MVVPAADLDWLLHRRQHRRQRLVMAVQVLLADEVSGDGSGFAGGGQIGCDYEFGGGFVIGARELLDYTSNSKSGTFPAGGPLAVTWPTSIINGSTP